MSLLQDLYWISELPIDRVSLLYDRYEGWYNPGFQDVTLYVMKSDDVMRMLVDVPGRPKWCDRRIAKKIISFFEEEEDIFGDTNDHCSCNNASDSTENIIDVIQLMAGLTLLCKGTENEKLNLIFRLFDQMQTGSFTEGQMVAMIEVICLALHRCGQVFQFPERDQIVAIVDSYFTTRATRVVSVDDLREWVLSSKQLQSIFAVSNCWETYRGILTKLDKLTEEFALREIHESDQVYPNAVVISTQLGYAHKNAMSLRCQVSNAPCTLSLQVCKKTPTNLTTFQLAGYVDGGFETTCLFKIVHHCVDVLETILVEGLQPGSDYELRIEGSETPLHVCFENPSDLILDCSADDKPLLHGKDAIQIRLVDLPVHVSSSSMYKYLDSKLETFDMGDNTRVVCIPDASKTLTATELQPILNDSYNYANILLCCFNDGQGLIGTADDMPQVEDAVAFLFQTMDWMAQSGFPQWNIYIVCMPRTQATEGQWCMNAIVSASNTSIYQVTAFPSTLIPGKWDSQGRFALPSQGFWEYHVSITLFSTVLQGLPQMVCGPILGPYLADRSVGMLLETNRQAYLFLSVYYADEDGAPILHAKYKVMTPSNRPLVVRVTDLEPQRRYTIYIAGIENAGAYETRFATTMQSSFLLSNFVDHRSGVSAADAIVETFRDCEIQKCLVFGLEKYFWDTDMQSLVDNDCVAIARERLCDVFRTRLSHPLVRNMTRSFLHRCVPPILQIRDIPDTFKDIVEAYTGFLCENEGMRDDTIGCVRFANFDDLASILDALDYLIHNREGVLLLVEDSNPFLNVRNGYAILERISALCRGDRARPVVLAYPAASGTLAWSGTITDSVTGYAIYEVCVPTLMTCPYRAITGNLAKCKPPPLPQTGRFTRTSKEFFGAIGCASVVFTAKKCTVTAHVMESCGMVQERVSSNASMPKLPGTWDNIENLTSKNPKIDNVSVVSDMMLQGKQISEAYQKIVTLQDELRTMHETHEDRKRVIMIDLQQTLRDQLVDTVRISFPEPDASLLSLLRIADLATMICDLLPKYYKGLRRVQKKATDETRESLVRNYSQTFGCTTYIYEMLQISDSMRTTLLKKASAIDEHGQVRLTKDGVYAFNEEKLTIVLREVAANNMNQIERLLTTKKNAKERVAANVPSSAVTASGGNRAAKADIPVPKVDYGVIERIKEDIATNENSILETTKKIAGLYCKYKVASSISGPT